MTDARVIKEHALARYARFADGYVVSTTHAKGAELARLVELADPRPDWVVLDVATGGGHTALAFAPHVKEVVASDITPPMLTRAAGLAREKDVANVSYGAADAEALPFGAGSFDLVTCRIAPHHFPVPARFVAEAARVLRPAGKLLIQDHMVPRNPDVAAEVDAFERRRDPSHVRGLSLDGWLRLMATAGFSVDHAEEIVKRHDFAEWTARQGNDAATKRRLSAQMESASPGAREWMAPRNWGTPAASFANHHVILVAHL